MTPGTEEIPTEMGALAENLTEAQRRTLMCLPANGNHRYNFNPDEIGGLSPLARKGLAEKMWSPFPRDNPWRLTPLGLALRAHLQANPIPTSDSKDAGR